MHRASSLEVSSWMVRKKVDFLARGSVPPEPDAIRTLTGCPNGRRLGRRRLLNNDLVGALAARPVNNPLGVCLTFSVAVAPTHAGHTAIEPLAGEERDSDVENG